MFKKGDRVRCIGDNLPSHFHIKQGREYIVWGQNGSHVYLTGLENRYYYSHRFELVKDILFKESM